MAHKSLSNRLSLLTPRVYSATSLFIITFFLMLDLLSCSFIHGIYIARHYVTVGKLKETVYLGIFGYCYEVSGNKTCFRKGVFYKVDKEIDKDASLYVICFTVVYLLAFISVALTLIIGLFDTFARYPAMLGLGTTFVAFLMVTVSMVLNHDPRSIYSFGFVSTTLAMFMFLVFFFWPKHLPVGAEGRKREQDRKQKKKEKKEKEKMEMERRSREGQIKEMEMEEGRREEQPTRSVPQNRRPGHPEWANDDEYMKKKSKERKKAEAKALEKISRIAYYHVK